MKRLAFSVLSSLVMASPAFAIVGGPWDNNMFYGRELNGTYQGVINGKNISGITYFGTSSSSEVGKGSASDIGIYGNGGRAMIFVNGNLLLCDISATANIPGRQMTIALDGSVSYGTTDSAEVVKVAYAVSQTSTTSGTGADAVTVVRTATNVSTTTTVYTLQGAAQVAGIIPARINKTFPTVEYTGSGNLDILYSTRFVQVPSNTPPRVVTDRDQYKVRATGVRTSTQNPFIVGTLPWYSTSVSTQTTVTTSAAPPAP